METELVVITDEWGEEITRPVTLSNEEWLVVSQCVEAFCETYRTKHSQTIATYVTRGQMKEASEEAFKMNQLLQQLDTIQARLL